MNGIHTKYCIGDTIYIITKKSKAFLNALDYHSKNDTEYIVESGKICSMDIHVSDNLVITPFYMVRLNQSKLDYIPRLMLKEDELFESEELAKEAIKQK